MKKMNFSNMQDLGTVLTPEEMKAIFVDKGASAKTDYCYCSLRVTDVPAGGTKVEHYTTSDVNSATDCEAACRAKCKSHPNCLSVERWAFAPADLPGSGSGSGSGSDSEEGSGSPCTCHINKTSGQTSIIEPDPMAFSVNECKATCNSLCQSDDHCKSVYFYFDDGKETGSGTMSGPAESEDDFDNYSE